MGTWYAFPRNNPNLTIAEDREAPASPPAVIRTRFKQGQRGGVASVNWGGWDAAGLGKEGQKRAVYISLWLKIEGRDFENQATGTKAGFIAFGREDKGSNEGVFFLNNGSGRQGIQSSFRVQFKQQGIRQGNGKVTRNLEPNVNRSQLMTVGQWHQWEAVLTLNEVGRPNGRFEMWIDGSKTMDYSNVVYVTPEAPLGFNLFKWNPTWGGSGGIRTREDFLSIDDVYISGLPLESRDPR